MNTWQKILREETFSNDFELMEDNDKYIVEGVISSYKNNLTANFEQVKDILDGAFKAGFVLGKRKYSSKTVYVLIKSYKNAHVIFQFSIQPNNLLVCEVVYGMNGFELNPTASKSKYFPHIYNTFDKSLPLDFMNVFHDKEIVSKEEITHINISDEYDWDVYFDYIYSFMIVMLEKLNDNSEIYLEESLKESKEDEVDNFLSQFDETLKSIKEFNSDIRIEVEDVVHKKEARIYIEWLKTYNQQSDENKNLLNTIIQNFIESIEAKSLEVDVSRARTSYELIRTIFIKYK